MSEPDFAQQRAHMVDDQLAARGIKDTAVLQAMRTVPREAFVPPSQRPNAYADRPLPIGKKQTISQPFVVALMFSLLRLQPSEQVLEIGTGSGYAAAVLSRIVRRVYTVERHRALAKRAQGSFEALGYRNIAIHHSDGTLGWPAHAPYDAIVVAAAAPDVPPPLTAQLAVNGRLLLPVGSPKKQNLVYVKRKSETDFERRTLRSVRFVPLIGQQGWPNPNT